MNRSDCRIFYTCTDKASYIDSHTNLLSKCPYFADHFTNNKSTVIEKDNYVINGYQMKFDFKQSTLLNILILLNGEVVYNEKEYLDTVINLGLEEYLPKIIEHLLDLILNLNQINIIDDIIQSKLDQKIKDNFNARVYYLTDNKLDNNIFHNNTYIDKNELIIYGHWDKLTHNHMFDGVKRELYFDTNKVDLAKDQLYFSIGCENGEEPDPFVPPSYSCYAKIQLIIYDGVRKDIINLKCRDDHTENDNPIRLPGYAPISSFKFGGLPRLKYTYELPNFYNKHMVHEYRITFL